VKRFALFLLLAASTLVPARAADAPDDAPTLLKAKGCPSCHKVAARNVGPSYQDIAARYGSDPQAAATVTASIRGGSAGKWGGTAQMPAFGALSEAQLGTLADWILAQRP
jgi:cytochrome c